MAETVADAAVLKCLDRCPHRPPVGDAVCAQRPLAAARLDLYGDCLEQFSWGCWRITGFGQPEHPDALGAAVIVDRRLLPVRQSCHQRTPPPFRRCLQPGSRGRWSQPLGGGHAGAYRYGIHRSSRPFLSPSMRRANSWAISGELDRTGATPASMTSSRTLRSTEKPCHCVTSKP